MKLLLALSIALQVATLGAQVPPRDVWALVRRPTWILRMGLAMFVAAPLLAGVLAKALDAPRVMAGAMVVLAVCAAAPLLPGKLVKLGIEPARDTALTIMSALLAIVLVPLEVELLGAWFDRDIAVGEGAVAQVLATTFIGPLAAGMLLNAVFGERAGRIARRLTTPASALLAVLVLVLIAAQAAAIFTLLRDSLLVVLLFAAGSLLIGDLLGGPYRRDRTSLAIAMVTRHPGLALLIVSTNFPAARDGPSAVLAFVIGMAIAAVPYSAWRRRQFSAQAPAPVVAA